MTDNENLVNEVGLDPADWDAMRALGHKMVDDMMMYLQGVRDRPVWREMPLSTKQALDKPLPLEPQASEDIYDEFKQHILPYPMGEIHPRFWAASMGQVLHSVR